MWKGGNWPRLPLWLHAPVPALSPSLHLRVLVLLAAGPLQEGRLLLCPQRHLALPRRAAVAGPLEAAPAFRLCNRHLHGSGLCGGLGCGQLAPLLQDGCHLRSRS